MEVGLRCIDGEEYANVSLGPGEFSDTHEVSRVCSALGVSCDHWGPEELEAPAWEIQEVEGYVIRGGSCPARPGGEGKCVAESGAPACPGGGNDLQPEEVVKTIELPYHLRYGAPGTVLPEFGPASVCAGIVAMCVVALWLLLCVVRYYRRQVDKILN